MCVCVCVYARLCVGVCMCTSVCFVYPSLNSMKAREDVPCSPHLMCLPCNFSEFNLAHHLDGKYLNCNQSNATTVDLVHKTY